MKAEVWAVVYSNYAPSEVIEIYDNEKAAQDHAAHLGGEWHAECWEVESEFPPKE